MSLHSDLLAQARHLARKEPKKPKQASLRRAVSAAYYAIFHMLVHEATRFMVSGARDRAALRRCLARAYAHRDMQRVAQQFADGGVSPKLLPGLNGLPLQPPLVALAETFVELQQARHEADYNIARRFTRREVLDLADRAEEAMADWRGLRRTAQADTFLAGLLAFGNMRG